eukprot:9259976-Pyramimonas_sp.AAC.1
MFRYVCRLVAASVPPYRASRAQRAVRRSRWPPDGPKGLQDAQEASKRPPEKATRGPLRRLAM